MTPRRARRPTPPSPLLRLRRALAAGALLAAPPAAAQDAAVGQRFPSITAEALSGREYRLPADFAGRVNAVFVAFDRDQQADVDTWVPLARELAAATPAFRFYELPTIRRAYRLMGPVISAGMKGGVREAAMRDATITLYTDVRAFRRALGLASDRTIYVLLLDAQGVVRWRADGAFTAEKGAELRRAAQALLAPAPRREPP